MSAFLRFSLLVALWLCSSATAADRAVVDEIGLRSPDGQIRLVFRIDEAGRPSCEANYRQSPVVRIEMGLNFAGAAPLDQGLKLAGGGEATIVDETYAIPVGKASSVRDQHHELIVPLEEIAAPRRRLNLAFRVFNDGIAFRYQLPEREAIKEFTLLDELTKITFFDNPTARYLALNGYTTSYEKHYEKRPLSEVRAEELLGLPVLLERKNEGGKSTWTAVTEANLMNFAGMYLTPVAGQPGSFAARLSPLPNRRDGAKVLGKAPFATPWRVIMIADDPGRLLESNIVFHLSDPPAIEDTSWIKPGKTTFPWWNGYVLEGVDFKPGLNTATQKHYIDFCAENGIEYHSLDGTDTAWYGGPIIPSGKTDITKSVPEIDLPELLRYAKEKGVRLRLWMHWRALAAQIDEAFSLYEKWGIEGVMVNFMDRDDQEMVAFYYDVAEKAARHKLTVTWHGAYKPTGMERTWPNVLSYEAALNQEYDKWDQRGTPPSHNLDIAFVRMLAGPLDYHQGGMRNVLPADFAPRNAAPLVQGTRAHQLALYVVYQNHLPMLVDYPAAYRGQPGLEFLASVPVSWDETRVLHAEVDRCLVIARRKGGDWYLGGIAGETEQQIDLKLDFLEPGGFQVELIGDDPSQGATAVKQSRQTGSAGDRLPLTLAAGGGFVAKISK